MRPPRITHCETCGYTRQDVLIEVSITDGYRHSTLVEFDPDGPPVLVHPTVIAELLDELNAVRSRPLIAATAETAERLSALEIALGELVVAAAGAGAVPTSILDRARALVGLPPCPTTAGPANPYPAWDEIATVASHFDQIKEPS